MSDLLELHGVSRSFGPLHAVEGVSFSVRTGARHAVIGPNGAGKSTLFDLIGGALSLSSGRIRLAGRDITGMAEHRRACLGIARTFQRASLFPGATAMENVLIAAQRHSRMGWHPVGTRASRRLAAPCLGLLATVGLAGRSHIAAGDLSHGERRQLELAMALAPNPLLLLLDEPAAGLSATDTARLIEIVVSLPATVTVLIVEHDLDVVFGLADAVTVLYLGRHLLTGTPDAVRVSEAVQRAYLGSIDAREFAAGTADSMKGSAS